jgi:hypothetical protein
MLKSNNLFSDIYQPSSVSHTNRWGSACIVAIWVLGIGACLYLLFPSYQWSVFAFQKTKSAKQSSSLGLQGHERYLAEIELMSPVSSGNLAQASPVAIPNLLVFSTKKAFLEYFGSKYPVDELLEPYEASLRKSGMGGPAGKIIVEAYGKKKGRKFGQQYKVTVKFDIKPVPQ